MIRAGIDIGSRTIKLVLMEENRVIFSSKRESGFDIIGTCSQMLEGVKYDSIRSTGYGRHLFSEHFGGDTVSEITAFANGTHFLYPEARAILDIGGQDTKAISIDANGKIRKFEMNDKCAAGTGRFLEIMAMALKFPLDKFGDDVEKTPTGVTVNSMCAVFAESEVVSLLARGVDRYALSRGIMESIIKRATTQLNKVGIAGDIVFVGGVAYNKGMLYLLGESLGREIITPSDPQIVGAIGAALL